MSQELEESRNEPERVYCTNALIKKVGRAIAVSLEDATLPGNTKKKHMTILYRGGRGLKWTAKEIELMSKETDNWIKQKYGNNRAPVTFTIHKWSPKSCTIAGDLNELCVHLRLQFAHFSNDEQRLPHVELFKHGRGHRHGKSHEKICHICGETGHFKSHCPMKTGTKHRNGNDNDMMYPTPVTPQTKRRSKKVTEKLAKMISKTNELKQKKLNEVAILHEQESKLQQLLDIADSLDAKTLRNEIKNIAKSFKNKKKTMRNRNKKRTKHARNEAKEERKLAKEERKRLKNAKKEKLALAQLQELPVDVGGDELFIYVDGYNIIGCDNLCRKSMRKRGGGMKKSRRRLTKLLQEEFINKYVKSSVLGLNYVPIIKLFFDGNGVNEVCGDIEITFSTKKQIVDDKLVEMFSKNNKKENENILVITSDRELTLRLYDIGVRVMKSSTFYKGFLKGDADINMFDADEKKEEIEPGTDDRDGDDSDEFVKIISKMNGAANEDQDTADTDYDEQVEGDNDENIVDEDYYEFTTIFGEDMDVDSN